MSGKKPTVALRPPPPAASVEAFVAGKVADKVSETPNVQTSERSNVKGKRALVARTRGGERLVRRVSVYLDPQTFKRLAVRCAEEDMELSAAVNQAVDAWLAKAT